jgi:putative inorganic carbon (HCO3(-)) transporter
MRSTRLAGSGWVMAVQWALFGLLAVSVVYERGTFEQGFSRAQLLSGNNALILGAATLGLVFFSLLLDVAESGVLIVGLLACSMSASLGTSGFAMDLPVQPVLLVNLPRLVWNVPNRKLSSLGWAGAFAVLVLASAVGSEEPVLAVRSTIRFISYLIGGVSLGICIGSRPAYARRALLLLASGGVLLSLRALYGLTLGAETVNDLGLNFAMPFVQDRGSGTASLLFGVTSAWALLRRKPPALERIVLWASVAITLSVVIIAGARAAYVGLLGAVLFAATAFSMKYARRLFSIALLGVVAAAVLGALDPGYLESLEQRYTHLANYMKDGRDFQTYDRLDYWGAAIEIAQDRPWLGVGYDQFSVRALDYGAVRYGLSAHNEYLKILSECGVFALAVYLAFILRTIVLGIRLRKLPDHWHLIEAATVGIVCYSVQGLFNNFQQVSKIMLPYFLFIGIVETFRQPNGKRVRS